MMFLLKGDLGFQRIGSWCIELMCGVDKPAGIVSMVFEMMIQKSPGYLPVLHTMENVQI